MLSTVHRQQAKYKVFHTTIFLNAAHYFFVIFKIPAHYQYIFIIIFGNCLSSEFAHLQGARKLNLQICHKYIQTDHSLSATCEQWGGGWLGGHLYKYNNVWDGGGRHHAGNATALAVRLPIIHIHTYVVVVVVVE